LISSKKIENITWSSWLQTGVSTGSLDYATPQTWFY